MHLLLPAILMWVVGGEKKESVSGVNVDELSLRPTMQQWRGYFEGIRS